MTQLAKAEVNQLRRSLTGGPSAATDPIELRGYPGIWRVRLEVGNRRMIIRVDRDRQRITVLEILRRADAYEKYPLPDDEEED